jgi:hypothetical protein
MKVKSVRRVRFTTSHPRFFGADVVQAIDAMSCVYVRLNELHDAVGARIASLLGCQAAMVTTGAFGGLMLGTAACVAGDNPDFVRRLPDTTGMKNEVIVQTAHRFPYDHAVRNCGVRLIEVETRAELERAIAPRTAMLLFLNKAEPRGQVNAAEFVRVGRAHGVRGNPRNALWPGARGPGGRIGDRSRRAGGQFLGGDCVAAIGFGLVHEFGISSSAHRSPSASSVSGTARGHYPLRPFARQFRFRSMLS